MYNDEAVHYVAESSQSDSVGSSGVQLFHLVSYPSLLSMQWAALTEVSFWLTGSLQFNVHSSFAEEAAFDLESLRDIQVYHHLRTVVSHLEVVW